MSRMVTIFRWGAAERKISAHVAQTLSIIPGLRKGRTTLRETEPVKPVDLEVVDATLPHLSPIVGAMVRFQPLTGARSGEVCKLKPCDVDRSDPSALQHALPLRRRLVARRKGKEEMMAKKAKAADDVPGIYQKRNSIPLKIGSPAAKAALRELGSRLRWNEWFARLGAGLHQYASSENADDVRSAEYALHLSILERNQPPSRCC